ncbi:hypothetical protein HYZ41_00400 [archaeon]|nr:hypothetical protein [archaeon]
MIHWFVFNLIVLIVALSLLLGVKNEITTAIAMILVVITIILMIKDFFMVRGE